MQDDYITSEVVSEHLLGMLGVAVEYPFDESTAVYKKSDMMFALVAEDKLPVRLSVRCDPQLSKILQEKYESVMPGDRLDKKYWITIVLSGQIAWDDIVGLITHSYNLVSASSD